MNTVNHCVSTMSCVQVVCGTGISCLRHALQNITDASPVQTLFTRIGIGTWGGGGGGGQFQRLQAAMQ